MSDGGPAPDGDGSRPPSGADGHAAGADRGPDEPAFEAPWQARAFALAVQLTERGEGEWPWEAFQRRLVEEIEADGDAVEATEAVYYDQWLRALERLLVEEGLLEAGELADRARAFEAGERDASEFVVGDRGHDHEHPHGGGGHPHDHGHAHDH